MSLNEKLDHYVQRAMADEEAQIYAFGQRWGPEPTKKDGYFSFLPGNGVHDIHMNQANVGQFTRDDGVYQDGALVNSTQSPEAETVTLLNVTGRTIDLGGWKLLDRNKNATPLSGQIAAGDTRRFAIAAPMVLSNKGGVITVINNDGLRVDGVTYTKAAASLPGFSVKF